MRWRFSALTLCALLASNAGDEPAEVWLGDELAVTYAASTDGDWILVEARHEPGWHTYAMDNVTRARSKSSASRVETELPTRVTAPDGRAFGVEWRQSAPLDLSDPEIGWYTWGFEGVSHFAVRLEKEDAPASVRIEAQACTEERCAMVDGLAVSVSKSESGSLPVDPKRLVRVVGAPQER